MYELKGSVHGSNFKKPWHSAIVDQTPSGVLVLLLTVAEASIFLPCRLFPTLGISLFVCRMEEALKDHPDVLLKVLEILCQFDLDSSQSPSSLFTRLSEILQPWPALLKGFAPFLLPEQAHVCGLVSTEIYCIVKKLSLIANCQACMCVFYDSIYCKSQIEMTCTCAQQFGTKITTTKLNAQGVMNFDTSDC